MKERFSTVALATETAVETLDAPFYQPVLARIQIQLLLRISVALDAPIRLAGPLSLVSRPIWASSPKKIKLYITPSLSILRKLL